MSKEPKSRGKVRVFLFELEGTDETLLESIKSIAGAVNRTFSSHQAYLPRPTAKPKTELDDELAQPPETEPTDGEFIEEGTDDTGTTQTKAKKPRRRRAPEVLNDLDLGSGTMSLKAYCAQKNPDNDINKYLVIAAWFKEYRNISEIGPSHAYTCYKVLDWTPIPPDVGQVFRSGKSASFFTNGSSRNLWAITLLGLNRVAGLDGKKP